MSGESVPHSSVERSRPIFSYMLMDLGERVIMCVEIRFRCYEE